MSSDAESPDSTEALGGKPLRFIGRCGSTCGKWKSRIRWKNRCTSRMRYRPPTLIPPMRPKAGHPARLGYYDNYLVDNSSCVIVGVQGTAARMSQETVASQEMFTRLPSSKDEGQSRWPQIPCMGTGSSCNGWRIGISLPTCGPVTVSTVRGSILRSRAFYLRTGK